ncbi:hypothetical protein [Brevibacillus agri]|uniref:Uncharacterized protein n=1 Tax=Brevibacillus agri TaxID=51101 RepID=A0A3M8BGQ7_9BACL|nr:hypothetical protein [Brevibacillus agri]MED1824434.1 hypothetical protein [Brevibacillus agri]QAV12627.1 hypothetical protein BA6348_07515 [Brevibacillus agri]RNB62157.1 hypothetical protein EB820_00295 [Brevibacillus agri]
MQIVDLFLQLLDQSKQLLILSQLDSRLLQYLSHPHSLSSFFFSTLKLDSGKENPVSYKQQL